MRARRYKTTTKKIHALPASEVWVFEVAKLSYTEDMRRSDAIRRRACALLAPATLLFFGGGLVASTGGHATWLYASALASFSSLWLALSALRTGPKMYVSLGSSGCSTKTRDEAALELFNATEFNSAGADFQCDLLRGSMAALGAASVVALVSFALTAFARFF